MGVPQPSSARRALSRSPRSWGRAPWSGRRSKCAFVASGCGSVPRPSPRGPRRLVYRPPPRSKRAASSAHLPLVYCFLFSESHRLGRSQALTGGHGAAGVCRTFLTAARQGPSGTGSFSTGAVQLPLVVKLCGTGPLDRRGAAVWRVPHPRSDVPTRPVQPRRRPRGAGPDRRGRRRLRAGSRSTRLACRRARRAHAARQARGKPRRCRSVASGSV